MRFRRFFATSVLAMGIGMSLGAVSASAAPSSDTFSSAGAIDITGTRGTTTSDLDTGTRETGEPTVPGSNTAHTKWWRYIPASNGYVRFSTCSPTGMNPVPGMSLGLYTGSQVNLLTTVSQATNNCPAGYDNAVLGPVLVTAGTYYYLQMGGANTIPVGEEGFNLTLDFNTAVPANDNWASATVISGALPQSFTANNGLATVEPNEPRSDDYNERQTLWYRWTATANGTISVNNCSSAPESAMDSRIAVFTGSSPVVATDMSFVDDNDNGCPGAASNMSRVYVPVTNGTSYWIKLSNNGAVNYGFPYSLQIKWITTPENGVVPSMYPTRFKVGTTVNVDFDGVWGGDPAPTFARQWRLCNAAGAACANISGATGTSYTPVVGDIGKTLVLQVTATNSNGSTSASSAPSEVIDNTPANDLWANRTNLGTGSTINYADDNNWATHGEAGEPTIGAFPGRNSVWYRWTPAISGDYVINNCVGGPAGLDFLDLMIGIRTGTTSLATTSEVGAKDDGCGPSRPYRTSMLFTATAGTNYTIEVASKSTGLTGAYTLSIAPVGDPVVTIQPSITGTAAPGGTLNLDVGDWISPTNIIPEIHWFSCNAAGTGCVDTGFSGTAFTVQGSHAGGTLRANVTLTNSYGTVTASALSDVIAQDSDGDGVLDGVDSCPTVAGTKPNGCLPSDIVGNGVPTITGNLVTGQTLGTTNGTWTVNNDPLGYTLSYQWQRCNDATPGSCSNIGGATGNTYLLVAGDLAKTIRVAVTATNADDTAQQFSFNTGFVTAPPAPPANSTPPAVSGNKVVGQTLSTTDGSWTPAGVGFTYEWLRCNDTTIGSCSAISSQTANTYTLAAADLGKYIRSRVTGANVSGSLPVASSATTIILGDTDGDGVPDVNDDCPTEAGPRANGCQPSDIVGAGVPTIAGPTTVGQTLSSNEGSWNVLHDPLGYTASYQWQRCEDATPASCSDIGAATSNTYVLVGADFGKRVRVNVTATNADDTAMQSSAISSVIAQVPGNTVLPALSGTARVGATLSTTQGTWVPLGVPLANSWLRCDTTSVVSCSVIAGQTGTSYTLVAADDGKYIRSRVTGSNGAGTTVAESAPSATVITDGDADGVADGSDACPGVAGTKPNGCPPSDIVGAGVPTISGVTTVGNTLTSTTGTWTVLNDQLGYTLGYQWQRCDTTSAASCSDISGATTNTYIPLGTEHGKYVRVRVTATNADDVATQDSAITDLIEYFPNALTSPSLSGTAQVGSTLTLDQGTWNPPAVSRTWNWLRCPTSLAFGPPTCEIISGQTGTNYTLTSADANQFIRVQITGTNTSGSFTTTTAPIGPITADTDGDGVVDASDVCPTEFGVRANGCAPSDIVAGTAPQLTATWRVGYSVASTAGTWTVLHDPLPYSVTYQWQRCTSYSVASCTNLIGATASTRTLTASDYGNHVRVIATATNADDVASQASNISPTISQDPANTSPPTVNGVATRNRTLFLTQGLWTPADAALTNEWLRCSTTLVSSCTTIPGQTDFGYTLTAADVGNYIRVRVTATTTASFTFANSAATSLVEQDSDGDGVADTSDVCPAENGSKPNGCLPSDIVGAGVPTVSGIQTVGDTLTSTTGTWTVLHDPLSYSISYQWLRCAALAATCVVIDGATSSSYTLVEADYEHRIRVRTTATNADDWDIQTSGFYGVIQQHPTNIVAPSISGTAGIGQSLTADQGLWAPANAGLANAWLRCDDNVSTASCAPIPSQTGSSYLLVAADDDKYIRLRVTGTTTAGTWAVTTSATAKIVADTDGDGTPDASDTCPSEASPRPNGCPLSDIVGSGNPTVSGTLKVGNNVSSTTGTWTVLHDPLSYALTYQWQRCDTASTASCTIIASATASTYALVAADYGKRVRVNVTATNAHDNDTQASAISNVISQVPANSVLPSVTGTTRVGNGLSGSTGTWTPGDASLARQWLRCTTTSIGSCTPIGSATGATYTLVAADSANYIRLQVSATAGTDTIVATSAATAQVFTDTDNDGVVDASDACASEAGTKPNGCLPSDIVGAGIPTITGFLATGQTINSTPGTWNVLHDQLGYTLGYQWQRCNDATSASCSDISLATGTTYVLAAADYGKRIRLNVTATNADDTALQSSAISAPVSEVPANVSLPMASGASKVGQTVTGIQGTWTPADATLTNVWLRCTTTSIGSCTPIAGQTGANYTLVAADDNRHIRLQVTATTTAGSTVATSAATALIVTDNDNDGVVDGSDACLGETGTKPNGCLPSDIVGSGVPTISGNLVVGQTMSSTNGTWNVLHDQLSYTLSRQWQRCDDATAGSCSDIGGETSSTYALTASDLAKRVRVIVTATNADDAASQSSAISTAVIAANSPPVNNVAPAISGTTEVGNTLTASGSSDDWTPSSSTLAYSWLRCTDSASEASCAAIVGADSSTYALVAADSGNYIRVRVTATASALSTEIISAASAKITTPAVVTPPPVTPPPPTVPNPATITGPANLKTLRPSKTRAVTFSRVSVYCGSKSTGNCTGQAVLTGKIGGKTKKLGTLKLSDLKGGGRIIAMKLSSSVIKALKKKSIKAQLAITYTSPGFAPQTYLGQVTLQKPKK